jgi:AAA family ATP:ADP antiporter
LEQLIGSLPGEQEIPTRVMARPIGQFSQVTAVSRFLGIERGELPAVAWSFVYFFCVMAAYYMLRSVREAMAIVSGVQNIPWLFTGTFFLMILATPVFGWVTSRFPRRKFLPWVYYFFVANILLFFLAFNLAKLEVIGQVWISRAFFVWLSVFNLFIVSVFWSFMADIYSKEQSRRLFGVISAGGSTGALLGPLLTSVLVIPIGFENLLPLSALLLLFAVYCVHRLRRWGNSVTSVTAPVPAAASELIGGSAWAGLRLVVTTPYFAVVAIAMVCANFLGGVTYMYMAQLVGDAFDSTDKQTQVFALMDAMTNALSFIGQLLLVKQSVRYFGIGPTLALLPLASIVGFALLAVNPVFIVMAALQVARRSLTFGFAKPTSDMLYAVVSKEAKYKAKNFIDTAIYRGGDLFSTWTIKFLMGFGITGISLICIPIAVIWTGLSLWIGREYKRRDQAIANGVIE